MDTSERKVLDALAPVFMIISIYCLPNRGWIRDKAWRNRSRCVAGMVPTIKYIAKMTTIVFVHLVYSLTYIRTYNMLF